MNIVKNMNGNDLTVALEGRLDTGTAPQLEAEMKNAVTAEVNSVTFDCAKLEYISSAGLRVLLSVNKAMLRNGKECVRVINCNEIVREVFEVTGFSDILNIA